MGLRRRWGRRPPGDRRGRWRRALSVVARLRRARREAGAAGGDGGRLPDGPRARRHGERDALEVSLAEQTYSAWERSRGTLAEALADAAATGDPLVLVEARGALASDGLARLAEAISRAPAPDLVYADEDAVVADGGRGDAFLKPGWSPELLVSTDYVGPLVALGPRAAAAALADDDEPPATIYDVLLRIVDSALLVERIPRICSPRRRRVSPTTGRRRAGRRAPGDPAGPGGPRRPGCVGGARDVRWDRRVGRWFGCHSDL